ncbi:cyclase family protein [Methylobacterium sp. EM32]
MPAAANDKVIEETTMCPTGCFNAICRKATRRGLLKTGFAAVAVASAGFPPDAGAAPAAPAVTRSFTDVVDLTHALYEGFPTFDGSKWFTMEPVFTYAKEKLNINRWTLMEHTGTHMDAPLHFSADGMSVDLLPVTDLVVPLAVIDIAARAQDNPDSAVTPDDIKAWETKHGPLPEGCCVAMHSGWGRLLASPRFVGRDAQGKNHTPGFHGETAHMLLTERKVKGLGVDTLSLDLGIETGSFPVHYSWLPSGRWGVECLANLDTLPAKGAHLVLGGPKVKGATGGPSRVMALV